MERRPLVASFPVILVRRVVVGNRDFGYFLRRRDLPVSPFVGLDIIIDPGCDPEEVEAVIVTEEDDTLVLMPSHAYDDIDDWDPDTQRRMFAFYTNGWWRDSDCDDLPYRPLAWVPDYPNPTAHSHDSYVRQRER